MPSGIGISGLLNFNNFRGSMPPDPPSDWCLRRASCLPPHTLTSSYGHVVSSVFQREVSRNLRMWPIKRTHAVFWSGPGTLYRQKSTNASFTNPFRRSRRGRDGGPGAEPKQSGSPAAPRKKKVPVVYK